MTHRNGRGFIASSGVLAAAMAALCALGCSGEVGQAGEGDKVDSTTEALNGQNIIIRYLDDRVATFFQVGISAVDQSNGGFYGGNATVPGPMTPGTTGADTMIWNENGLSQVSFAQNSAFVGIFDQSNAPHRFTTMRVSVLATINGGCHYDYEDIDLSHQVQLAFNGEGGTLVGNCWRGDLLHHF